MENNLLFAGSMIERIVAICATKADSLKWIECLQHQMKVARQPTAHHATPSHVSLRDRDAEGSPKPPYQLLSRDVRHFGVATISVHNSNLLMSISFHLLLTFSNGHGYKWSCQSLNCRGVKRWIRERVRCGDLTRKKVGLWTRGEVRVAPFKCYSTPPIVPSTPKRQKQRPQKEATNETRPKEGQRKAFKIEEEDFEALLARFSSDESLPAPGFKCSGIVGGSGPLTRDRIRFIDSTPSRETSVVRPVCAPVSLDYDEIWMRSPPEKAMAAMVASEVAERLMRAPARFKYPSIATHRSDLCAELWMRAKLLAPVAEEMGLFARPSVKSKRSGARIETLV